MDKLVISGGQALHGVIPIAGAKNATLPALAASILTDEGVLLKNVPHLQDVNTMYALLRHMGVQVSTIPENHTVTLHAASLNLPEAPYSLVKTMRAAILVLGPLLTRFGKAKVSLPGGCAIGARPIDQHLKGLRAMGADLHVEHGYVSASLARGYKRLQGAHIHTDIVTVTGCENLMMAACLAEGETIIENAAQEPEIVDLAEMLIRMGAKITGHGSKKIHIKGVAKLQGGTHTIISDRIEAGTFMCAVAATGGDVFMQNIQANQLQVVISKLRDAGVTITPEDIGLRVHSPGVSSGQIRAQSFRTKEYPGFPTDMQAQFLALNCVAQGSSAVTETVFENRFMHINELVRLGANIQVDGKTALLRGGDQLYGATVMATDLRASASLVIAALVAQGDTTIERIYHLDRGYERMEEKLKAVNAQIKRIKNH